MSMEQTYLNKNGRSVFTADFLKKRGSCCKSGCLHCPYHFTLNKYGLKLHELDAQNEADAREVYQLHFPEDSLANSLLGSAFKAKENPVFNSSNFKVVSLKDIVCGVVELEDKSFKKLYLGKYFQSQGITDSAVIPLFES